MKKWIWIIAIVGLLGFGYIQCQKGKAAQAAKESAGQKLTAKVERGDVTVTVIESGAIEAVQSVEIKSRVSGRVSQLLVKEGDRVSAGQLIARIDPEELKLQYKQVSAQLRGAESSAARSALNVGLTESQVKNALIQAEQRYITALREWQNQPALSRASVEQARISLDNAIRTRDLLVNTTHPQERVRLETTANQAKAIFERDKRELERQRNLLEKGWVSQQAVDNASATFAASEASYKRAQDEWSRMQGRQAIEAKNADDNVAELREALNRAIATANLDKNKEQALADAKASLEQAKANLRQIEMDKKSAAQSRAQADQIRASVADNLRLLNETEIRAPMNGIVTKKLIEPGELVSALSSFSGGTPIIEVSDLNTLQVKLQINEIDVARLELNDEATIDIDAIPEFQFHGVVMQIAPSNFVATTGGGGGGGDSVVRYEVVIKIKDPDKRIKPGMSARCTVNVENVKNVLRLPVEYIEKQGIKYFVNVQVKGGKPQKKEVTIGAISPQYMEIKSGVSEGEVIEKTSFRGPPRQGMMGGS